MDEQKTPNMYQIKQQRKNKGQAVNETYRYATNMTLSDLNTFLKK